MDVLTIYNPDGSKLLDACLDSSTQDWAIMSENRLQVEFYSEECILLPSGCYVDFDDRRFWLLDEYKPTLESSLEYAYNVKFVGAESLLSVTLMLKTTDGEDNPIFPLTAPAAQHLALIVANLRRRFPDIPWHVGDVIETENIYIEYAGTYCGDAIQQIVAGRDAEWWVDDQYGINVGRCELGDLVELGYQKGLIGGITHSLANNLRSYAYLCPIGSTRNIDPEKYGHDRLQLPNGIKLIPMNPEQGIAELAEANAFAGIYPRYIGEVTAVRTEEGTNEDGSKFTIYFVEDAAIPFNPNEYELPGKVKNITFQSGELMGAEFEVNYDEIAHEFEIITQWPNGGAQLPGGFLVPAVGDKYVVWNISMPDEYYPLAEEEFLTAARKFAQDSVKDASVYRAPVDYVDVQERGLTLRPGQRVRLLSAEYFPSTGYYDSRITRIVRDIRYPNEITVEISTVRAEGTIARLQSAIQQTETQLKQVEQSVGEMPAIITSTSVVQPTDSNVYSALRSNKEFLSKEKGGTVKKKVNFVESIQLFGRDFFRYDEVNDALELNCNLVVTGGSAFFAKLEGFEKKTITQAINCDGETIHINDAGQLEVIGGAGGFDEEELKSYLDEKKYVTESWVTTKNYALKTDLDTVSTKLNNFLEGSNSDTIINKWSELEVFLRGLAETDNLAEILSTKFDKADFTKANIKDKLGIYDWALAESKPKYKYSEIQDAPLRYDAETDAWELDGNLVVTGGMALFTKLEGFEKLSLTSSLNVDGTTISNAGGILRVIGGAGGGLDESALAEYLTTNKYATQSWVTSQKYLTSHQTIYDLTFKAGTFSAGTFDPNGSAATVNIPTLTTHISEGSNLYFTEARARSAVFSSSSVLTASRALVSNSNGKVAVSPVTSTELGYLDGVTSSIQDQLDDKLDLAGGTMTGDLTVKRSSAMIAAHNNKDYIGLHNEYHCGLWYDQGTTANGTKWLLAFNSERSAGWFTVPMAIGTTGAQPSYMLYVNGSSRFAGSLTPEAHLSYNIGSSSRAFVRTYTQYLDSPTSYNLRLCSAGTEVITITTAGNVRIGSPSGTSRATFDVTGDAFISGQLAHALTSDRRLKRNVRKFSAAKYLRSLGGVFEFEYIDEEVARDKYYEGTHLGFIYQNVKGSRLTGMCIERENGFGALNLLHSDYLALLGAAATEHEDRIHTLERQIKALQKELKQLKSA